MGNRFVSEPATKVEPSARSAFESRCRWIGDLSRSAIQAAALGLVLNPPFGAGPMSVTTLAAWRRSPRPCGRLSKRSGGGARHERTTPDVHPEPELAEAGADLPDLPPAGHWRPALRLLRTARRSSPRRSGSWSRAAALVPVNQT
jgi:hypothetical protein